MKKKPSSILNLNEFQIGVKQHTYYYKYTFLSLHQRNSIQHTKQPQKYCIFKCQIHFMCGILFYLFKFKQFSTQEVAFMYIRTSYMVHIEWSIVPRITRLQSEMVIGTREP